MKKYKQEITWYDAIENPPPYGKKVLLSFTYPNGDKYSSNGKRDYTDENGDNYSLEGITSNVKILYWTEIPIK